MSEIKLKPMPLLALKIATFIVSPFAMLATARGAFLALEWFGNALGYDPDFSSFIAAVVAYFGCATGFALLVIAVAAWKGTLPASAVSADSNGTTPAPSATGSSEGGK